VLASHIVGSITTPEPTGSLRSYKERDQVRPDCGVPASSQFWLIWSDESQIVPSVILSRVAAGHESEMTLIFWAFVILIAAKVTKDFRIFDPETPRWSDLAGLLVLLGFIGGMGWAVS